MGDTGKYQPGLGRNSSLVQQLRELQRNPRSLVFLSLADSYRAEGLTHQALEILDEGLEHHPNLTSAVVAKARCLFELRRYAEAMDFSRRALSQNPENLKAHKLQAEIFVRLGQKRAAIRALTHVLALFPQDAEAERALLELRGVDTLDSSPMIEPPTPRGREIAPTVGRIDEFQVGSFPESVAEIVKSNAPVVDDMPTEAEDDAEAGEPAFATRTIAELYLRQGLRAKAARVLRKMMQLDPANAWARETLQGLESSGIVATSARSNAPKPPSQALARRASRLEQMLSRVRLLKRLGA